MNSEAPINSNLNKNEELRELKCKNILQKVKKRGGKNMGDPPTFIQSDGMLVNERREFLTSIKN
jgi:hypothetical protein